MHLPSARMSSHSDNEPRYYHQNGTLILPAIFDETIGLSDEVVLVWDRLAVVFGKIVVTLGARVVALDSSVASGPPPGQSESAATV